MQSSSPMPSACRRRRCLFGGSFDPIHLGHTALAAAAYERCGLENVVFIPAWQSPHKLEANPPAPAGDRVAMLELAVAGLPWAEIDRSEIERGGPSYSWETADHQRERAGPSVELCWLLGADQWAQIDRWAHPEKLAAGLTFLVFPRGAVSIDGRPGFRHQVIDFRHPASSTAVRAAVRGGQPLDGLVAPAVAEYIREHQLYGAEPAGPEVGRDLRARRR
jgi:nicotinate-nucleotide adenylyltransferase